VESPLWGSWFKVKHEERRTGIDAYLKDLKDEDVDHEVQEETHHAPSPPSVAVKEELSEWPQRHHYDGFVFPTLRPGCPD
jgi:hypothetical protein